MDTSGHGFRGCGKTLFRASEGRGFSPALSERATTLFPQPLQPCRKGCRGGAALAADVHCQSGTVHSPPTVLFGNHRTEKSHLTGLAHYIHVCISGLVGPSQALRSAPDEFFTAVMSSKSRTNCSLLLGNDHIDVA